MRTFAFSALAVSALLLSVSCRNEEVPAVPGGATRTITVHTGNADSKTAVYFDGTSEKYKTTWKAGDLIDLFEFSQDGVAYAGSSPLEEDASSASFEVTFDTDAPDATPLRYVGVYPEAWRRKRSGMGSWVKSLAISPRARTASLRRPT